MHKKNIDKEKKLTSLEKLKLKIHNHKCIDN